VGGENREGIIFVKKGDLNREGALCGGQVVWKWRTALLLDATSESNWLVSSKMGYGAINEKGLGGHYYSRGCLKVVHGKAGGST